MPDLFEFLQRGRTDSLGGGGGSFKVRELPFQAFQLPHELIVFEVGDDRVVENVIPVIVVVNLFPKLIDSLFRLRFVHKYLTAESAEIAEVNSISKP
jgi:hypothetical protein